MADNDAVPARILTFAPDGRVVDASRGSFEPQTMRVSTGSPDARPYADLSDVPVSRVYLGVQPGTTQDGASTSLATAAQADRSFIVVERENGYKQVIETSADVAQRAGADLAVPVASADLAAADPNVPSNADRGAPSGVAAETDLGAYLSPDAVTVDLTAPTYAGTGSPDLTRYANELLASAQSPGRSSEARGRTDVPSTDARQADLTADSWTSSLVREAGGAAGAADLQRVAQQLEAKRAETAARTASNDTTSREADLGRDRGAGSPSNDPSRTAAPSPDARAQTLTSGGGGGPNDPSAATSPERDPSEPKPDLTPVERAETPAQVEKQGREVIGDRPAFDRAADARLDGLAVKYNEFSAQETLASERASNARAGDKEMQYVRDGEPATARAGYQQDGRIVGMTAETVTQDIGQGKTAVYSTKGLMETASDPAALQATLQRAADQNAPVELNFSRSGGLSAIDLQQTQGRGLGQDQDRGMGRSLI